MTLHFFLFRKDKPDQDTIKDSKHGRKHRDDNVHAHVVNKQLVSGSFNLQVSTFPVLVEV